MTKRHGEVTKPAGGPRGEKATGMQRRDLIAWRARADLRRSNAAVPHRNKKRYTRTQKHGDVSGYRVGSEPSDLGRQ